MASYHYTECGLDNVFIEGMEAIQDHDGDEIIMIEAVGALHKVIAEGIVCLPSKMGGKELRFLRTEMGLTQAQLGEVLKVTLLTVSRWERDEKGINDAAEMLVRLLTAKRLDLDIEIDVDTVSGKVTTSPEPREIHIDGSNAGKYHLIAA